MEAQEQPLQLTQIQMTKEPLDQTTILARTPTNRDEENHALEVIHTRTIEQARCIDCAGSLEDTDKRQDSKHESHVEAEKNIVDWDGPDDPENPKNMTEARKWAIVGATGAMTFCVSFSSSVFSTTVFQTAAEFHVSTEVMLLGVSLYVLGFAFGMATQLLRETISLTTSRSTHLGPHVGVVRSNQTIILWHVCLLCFPNTSRCRSQSGDHFHLSFSGRPVRLGATSYHCRFVQSTHFV